MLVTPHHQVKKFIQELLRNVVGGTVLTPGKNPQTENIEQNKNIVV